MLKKIRKMLKEEDAMPYCADMVDVFFRTACGMAICVDAMGAMINAIVGIVDTIFRLGFGFAPCAVFCGK